MKTYILIVLALGLFVSCQEDVNLNSPDLNLSNAPDRLEQMYLEGLDIAVQSLDLTLIEGEGKGMLLDNRLLKSKTFHHLEKNYFQT